MSDDRVTGLLGGTFDPVHLGHLELADRSIACMGLDALLLLPSSIPPHKSRPHLTSCAHRVEMLRLAIEGRPRVGISTYELDRGGICYTIETLRELSRGEAALTPVFILGTDSLSEIRTWRDYRDLLREFDLAVLDRPGSLLAEIVPLLPPEITASLVIVPDGPDGPKLVRELQPGRGGRIFHLPVEPNPVSSSMIRKRIAAGESIAALVTPAVGRYILENGLYRQEESR